MGQHTSCAAPRHGPRFHLYAAMFGKHLATASPEVQGEGGDIDAKGDRAPRARAGGHARGHHQHGEDRLTSSTSPSCDCARNSSSAPPLAVVRLSVEVQARHNDEQRPKRLGALVSLVLLAH